MDLPNLFIANTDGATKLIICIVLSDASVQSLLLSISLQGTKIEKRSSVIPYSDTASCIIKIDESLQELGKESEAVNEVLFGLEQAWLENSQIIDSKKDLLHKITTELSLKPLGFVVQTEALYQHYVSHNAHASIILITFSEQFLTVVVVTQGKMKLTETVGRSNDIVADIQEALARYTKKHESTYLPSKLVCASLVLDETELTQYQQMLLDVSWNDAVPFVQKPTVDVMRSDLAISLIAQQAGHAIAAAMSKTAPNQAPPVEAAEANLGFEQVSPADLKKETAVDESVANAATSFGIPIKSELVQTKKQEPETLHAIDGEIEDEEELLERPSLWKKITGQQQVAFGGSHKKYNLRTLIIIGVVSGFLVLSAIAAVFIFFFSQVSAVIIPKDVVVSKEVQLTIDPEAQASDPQNLIIPGESVSKSITREATIETTGVKIVGDKAKGEVLIYNKTTSEKTLAAGTVLAKDDFQFLTDSEVVLPAAVVEEQTGGSQTDYGEKTVAVTAYNIGVEGNIEEKVELSVADFDKTTYSAVSIGAFSGGSSREVRVVAQDDLDAALAEARKAALDQANMEFAQESQDGVYILPTSSVSVTDQEFSAELEKEANDITASVTAEIIAISYRVADLKPLATDVLASEVPSGYSISPEDPQILSAPAESVDDKNKVALSANISTKANPVLDENSIKQEIAGKPVEEATAALQARAGVKSASLVFYPSWAKIFIGTIPSQLERITVEKIQEE